MHAGPWFRHVEAFLNCVFYNFHHFPMLFCILAKLGEFILRAFPSAVRNYCTHPCSAWIGIFGKICQGGKALQVERSHWSAPCHSFLQKTLLAHEHTYACLCILYTVTLHSILNITSKHAIVHIVHDGLSINHSSVIPTTDIPLGNTMRLRAAQNPLVHVDYIRQYAAQLEYVRRMCSHLPPWLNCVRSSFISGLSLICQTLEKPPWGG